MCGAHTCPLWQPLTTNETATLPATRLMADRGSRRGNHALANAAETNQPRQLRLFDPRLADGLRDERLSELRCLAARPPKHVRGVALTARAAGRVFCGGDGPSSGAGRVNAWSTNTGSLICAAALDAPATCLAVVDTVHPAPPLRVGPPKRAGAADGFGCELMIWVGQADGRIAVLAGGDLALRVVLGGHRGMVTCICSPGAPPSAAAVGASVVLSGGEDGAMRMWDARTAECLRSIPGGGAALRAMVPVWSPDGGDKRSERCRIWSADAERTLCVWEPRRTATEKPQPQRQPQRGQQLQRPRDQVAAPKTVTLTADVSDLTASTDGTLVCATAGRDGVLVLDGNARLRSRLVPNDAAMEDVTAVIIIGRGRQVWTGSSEGGLALWERVASAGGGHDMSMTWSYHCTRRLSSPPLLALRPAATSQVWGACADGTIGVWLAEGSIAEMSEMLTMRTFLGQSGANSGVSTGAVHRAIAVPLLKLLRVSLDELRRAREEYATLLSQINEAWAQMETDRQLISQHQDKLAVALNVETIARIETEDRNAALVKEVDALVYDLSHLGQSRDQALALKAARESEVGRLKKVESKMAQRLKKEEEVGRQLAETRVQSEKLRSERDRAFNEMRTAKRELLEMQKAERADIDALADERDALAAGLEQRSIEMSSLTEALRAREASETAAREELTQLRTKHQNHEEENARMKHEREQMRAANSRMQALLERLRVKMGQDTGLAQQLGAPHLGQSPYAPDGPRMSLSYDVGEPAASEPAAAATAPPMDARHSTPAQAVMQADVAAAMAPTTSQQQLARRPAASVTRPTAVQMSGCSSSRRRPTGSKIPPESSCASRVLKPTVRTTLASARPSSAKPSSGRCASSARPTPRTYGVPETVAPQRSPRVPETTAAHASPRVLETTAPQSSPHATARQPAFDAPPLTPSTSAVRASASGEEVYPVERRSVAEILRLAELS